MDKREHKSGERYDALKKMLNDRLEEVNSKRRELRESLADQARVNINENDGADQFARGLDFALTEMKSQTLAQINDAMTRLDKGTYGICTDCENPIAAARLKALPFAVRCRDCQEGREETGSDAR
jgi:DnaK suppressor protein